MPMTLPYDMGNAGDLVKHGVLAEFVRWQCELGIPLRFMDPFGGEPWERPVPEVARRVRALKGTALHTAQTDIEDGRYYGSAFVVLHAVGRPGVMTFTFSVVTSARRGGSIYVRAACRC